MNLMEIFEPTPAGYSSEKDDNTTFKPKNTRAWKTHLTLDRLNKLRIMNDVRKLEHEKKLDTVADQYKPAAAAAAGGLGI